MSERSDALNEAAAYVEFYAEERMRLCGDSIMLDPVLSGRDRGPVGLAKSRKLQIDGTINSAAYHAAKDIADHLRKMAQTPGIGLASAS